MSAWVHVNAFSNGDCSDWFGETTYRDSEACNCTTPTPDPASPCGHPTCNQRAIAHVHMKAHGVHGRHPHVPTRCTCGHAIKEARP